MARDLIDLRRRVLQSISYPLIVMAVAVVLFCAFIRVFLSRVSVVLSDPASDSVTPVLNRLIELDQQYWWWPAVVPAVALGVTAVWVASGRASSMAFRGPERILFLVPGVSGLVRDLQFYTLARTLALLVERELALPEALLLAGACSGNVALDKTCRTASAKIGTGGLPPESYRTAWRPGALPPLLAAAVLQKASDHRVFQQRLHSVSAFYRRRLTVSTLWVRNVVPMAMFLVIGGGTLFLYAMSVFWPVTEMYYQMGVR